MISRDRIAGAFYGLALGDALGAPTEFMSLKEIYRQFGSHGAMPLSSTGHFTDDTQMTLAVSTALRYARSITPRETARTLRQEFINWWRNDPPRSPGSTCIHAIMRMAQNPAVDWVSATVADSKGCGANMRVTPAAFIRDLDDALGFASLQAAMTHGHPVALAATELTALAIRWAAQDMSYDVMVDRLLAHAVSRSKCRDGGYRSHWLGQLSHRWARTARQSMRDAWLTCVDSLLNLRKLLDDPNPPRDICRVLGGAWVAEEALVTGLYFAIKYDSDPLLVISEAARTSGDSDSIACIAGAITGARHGESAWPTDWRARIERRNEIEWAINVATVTIR